MNYFPNRAVRIASLLFFGCWLAFVISAPTYSHDVSAPSHITSSDGTPAELVTHTDLYDLNGNFVTHLHKYKVRAGDVDEIRQSTYGSPGFEESDDPDSDNHGTVGNLPDPPGTADSQDVSPPPQQRSRQTQVAHAPVVIASAQVTPNNEGGESDTQGLPPLPDVTPQNPEQPTSQAIQPQAIQGQPQQAGVVPQQTQPQQTGVTPQPTQPQATQGQPQQTGVTPQPTPQATQPQGRQQTHVPQQPLRVTEYMVRDWSRSAGGDLPQWIELYNPNPNPILLHNCFFSYVVHQGFNKKVKHVQVDNFTVPAKKAVIFVTRAVGPNRFAGVEAAQVYALNIPNSLKSGWLLRTATGGVIFKAGEEFGGARPHAPNHVEGNRQSFTRYAEADTETAYYYGSAWDIGTPGYHEPVRAAPSVLRKKIGLWGALKQ